jgi:hypothetical protein
MQLIFSFFFARQVLFLTEANPIPSFSRLSLSLSLFLFLSLYLSKALLLTIPSLLLHWFLNISPSTFLPASCHASETAHPNLLTVDLSKFFSRRNDT